MIKAILCTTNNSEPWGAQVPFEVNETYLTTELNTRYSHYKNISENPLSVIVYVNDGIELIAKSICTLESTESEEKAKATFKVNWLRVVKPEGIQDFDTHENITRELRKLSS